MKHWIILVITFTTAILFAEAHRILAVPFIISWGYTIFKIITSEKGN